MSADVKITKSQLERIILEEIEKIAEEGDMAEQLRKKAAKAAKGGTRRTGTGARKRSKVGSRKATTKTTKKPLKKPLRKPLTKKPAPPKTKKPAAKKTTPKKTTPKKAAAKKTTPKKKAATFGTKKNIRPNGKVPSTGIGSKVFKGKKLSDIAKELGMKGFPKAYRNVDDFLAKALRKRRRSALPPGAPLPGSPGWKKWLNEGAGKWLVIAGLTAALAAGLGSDWLTDDEREQWDDGGDPAPGWGGEPDTPEGGEEGAPEGNAGPNAEACKTARGLRKLLKQKAEEVTGKKGIKALTGIPLEGDENSWVRVSYRKLWAARSSRKASEAARAEIVAQHGVQLGCTVGAEEEPGAGGMVQLQPTPGMLGVDTQLNIDPSLSEPIDTPEELKLKQGKSYLYAKKALDKNNAEYKKILQQITQKQSQIVKAVLGRPLQKGENFEGLLQNKGLSVPRDLKAMKGRLARYRKSVVKLKLLARKYLKSDNPNYSNRQLDAYIEGKPMFGSGETPADLPQRGQRDKAALGLTAAEREKLDMTGGPPVGLQESKQLDRMKLLAGIKNENK